MDSKNLLNQLEKLSKRKYTLKYSSLSFSNLFLYESIYRMGRGKTKKVNFLKVCSQYFLQTILGIYKTDYGLLTADYFVAGSDTLVGLISSYQLLKDGNSVVFYDYSLNDYSVPTRVYSEKRYHLTPTESVHLIIGELGLDITEKSSSEEICNTLVEKIKEDFSEQFIFLRNVNLSDFHEVQDGRVCSLVKSHETDNGVFLSSNELVFMDSLSSGINSNRNRRRGRVISMIKSKKVVLVSQKTKLTPRTSDGYEIRIADGERETQSVKCLYVKDRNKDIVEALAINEKIRYSNGIS